MVYGVWCTVYGVLTWRGVVSLPGLTGKEAAAGREASAQRLRPAQAGQEALPGRGGGLLQESAALHQARCGYGVS